MSAAALLSEYPPPPEPLPWPVVDNHTHLDLPAAGRYRGPASDQFPTQDDVATLLAAAAAVGVPRAVQIGCDLPAARWTAQAVERHPELLGGVGIHPNEAPRLAARGVLDDALTQIERLARHPRVRVVGETGLDWYRTDPLDAAAATAAQDSFRAHVELAKRLGRVLQIHDRDAHDDVLAVLRECGAPERTVFHCFSGDADMAGYCSARGWYVSFAGTVTFKNAATLRQALRVVPLDLLLVETDAPYLTPAPHRGRANASHLVPHTVRAIADVRGERLDRVCEALAATSERVYGPW